MKFPASTAIGALSSYISDANIKNFQPMNVNFGLFSDVDTSIRDKKKRNTQIAERSLGEIVGIYKKLSKCE